MRIAIGIIDRQKKAEITEPPNSTSILVALSFLEVQRNDDFQTYISPHIVNAVSAGHVVWGSIFQSAQMALIGHVQQVIHIQKEREERPVFVGKIGSCTSVRRSVLATSLLKAKPACGGQAPHPLLGMSHLQKERQILKDTRDRQMVHTEHR